MSNELPASVMATFDGRSVAEEAAADSDAWVLATAPAAGAPRLALLSLGEILAVHPTRLRLALHVGSTSCANLRAGRPATLLSVRPGDCYVIELMPQWIGDTVVEGTGVSLFDAQVLEVREQQVPYADVTSSISFRLHDPAPVWQRWRATLRRLRDAKPE